LGITADAPVSGHVTGIVLRDFGSDAGLLRALVVFVGLSWSVLFVVVGLRYDLQTYADGSIFSYAVAVQDAWAFHWHNISGRLFVYLFSSLPAETFVALTGNARGGIAVYGFLFFVAQFLGLCATFAVDRSKGRIIFCYACLSTACLCPLVFGFPTEMWMAHALFWPTLAVCHFAGRSAAGAALIFVLMLSLVFTHGGAVIFALVILLSLLLRGTRDPAVPRATAAFLAAMSASVAVELTFPADPYVASVLRRAALHVFDISILGGYMVLLLVGVLASYGIAVCLLRRFAPARAQIYAGFYASLLIAVLLTGYWLWFDHALHAEDRYHLRTILIVVTPALGLVAAAHALRAEDRLHVPRMLRAMLAAGPTASTIMGGVLLVMLVHAVETAKFVAAWTRYRVAVRALAMGTASDPVLGSAQFVSSERIPPDLNRLSWFSTTPFLSVLVAPAFAPARLVVDPHSNYFWLTCKTATANAEADRAIPVASRELVRLYECLHR